LDAKTVCEGTSGFNDLVVIGGAAFVTDTEQNTVYRVVPNRPTCERIVRPDRLHAPNGIAAAADGRTLFVADAYGIWRIDPGTGECDRLPQPRAVVSGGIDGLYYRPGMLIGIQNAVHPGRVLRFWLNASENAIVGSEVLESYNSRFNIPTTGAIDGN